MGLPPVQIPPPDNAMVKGIARGRQGHRVGVYGSSVDQPGVWAEGDKNVALYAKSTEKAAIHVESDKSFGVFATTPATGHEAIHGETRSPLAAVAAYSDSAGAGCALWAERRSPGGLAGRFVGNVACDAHLDVKGNITCDGQISAKVDIVLGGADCAEEFDIAGASLVEPGTVMVLGPGGSLSPSERPYDKCAVGIVSGAGCYRPGLVLDKRETLPGANRMPIALLGKAYCKVDASFAAIGVGDLLTTSPTPGHAMKATDREQAFGAVIGKALAPIAEGTGLIPVLVSLQ